MDLRPSGFPHRRCWVWTCRHFGGSVTRSVCVGGMRAKALRWPGDHICKG